MTDLPKAALITGAAKRLGREMALALARDGFNLAIHYGRSQAEAEATALEIAEIGRRVVLIQADLAAHDQVATIMPRANQALGPLGLLVNNASIFELDRIATVSDESWQRHMAINLAAPVRLAQAFVAQLPPKAEGLIVNMLDERVFNPTPNYLSYTVSRYGLWAATEVMARDLAPRIRVNAIGPGPALPAPGRDQAEFEALCRRMPLRRGTTPDEIAAALLFILRARSMTGQLLTLDGGQQLGWLTPAGPPEE